MFYSQFILAKKGPLGTIWIAAHLERKLRKNQVADTDIGVSVDSILCPEVPIALRLSSHLLVGVVRIYSRKVNYLFDDCSEALLKIKQAFRSTAVDLPPEESKAPYHSITLPETFDLDDFELPDNDFFQGNYVDHHTSTREQITLQDNMEGVVYSTSQFGLDERFGDGETSGLNLDEEIFLHKVDRAGHAGLSADHQSAQAATQKQDEGDGGMPANPEPRIDNLYIEGDLMDYAQAPSTPGLVEMPNSATIQEISTCEDHMDDDDNPLIESVVNGDLETFSKLSCHQGNAQSVDWSLPDDKKSVAPVDLPCEENGNHLSELEIEKRLSPSGVGAQHISSDNSASASATFLAVANEAQALHQAQELKDGILKTGDVNGPSVSGEDHVECNGTISKESAGDALCSISCLRVPGVVSDDDQSAPYREKSKDKEVSGDSGRPFSSNGALRSSFGQQVLSPLEKLEDTNLSNVAVSDEILFPQVHILWPCSAGLGIPDSSHAEGEVSNGFDLGPDVGVVPVESSGGGETIHASRPAIVLQDDNLDINLKEDHNAEPGLIEVHAGCGKSDGQVKSVVGGDSMLENICSSVSAVFPAPEKLLSVPDGHNNQPRNLLLEATPGDLTCVDESDVGSKIISGKKRSYTESTLTEQSLNSVESTRVVCNKRTAGAIPDDDDLLSSILVGRRSSILKVKPTPIPYELASVKRQRHSARTSASKRKVLMDDTMVLHGDTIRQQLTNTEDIRRLRKKAPCTRAEISIILKQYLEDEIFSETLCSGVSASLASFFNQASDLSRIKVSKDDANGASMLSSDDTKSISVNEGIEKVTGSVPAAVVETDQGDCAEFAVVKEDCHLHLDETILLDENKLDEDHELGIGPSITDLEMNPTESKEEAVEPNGSLPTLPQNLSENQNGGTSVPSEAVDVAQSTSPDKGVGADALVEMEASVVSIGDIGEVENVKLDASLVDGSERNVDDERFDKVKSGDTFTVNEVEPSERDGPILEGTQCAGTVEVERYYGDQAQYDTCGSSREIETDMNRGHCNEPLCAGTSCGPPIVASLYPSEFRNMPGSFLDDSDYLIQHEGYPTNVVGVETSGLDVQYYNDFNHSATANDTEFLNVDDDEVAEVTDDYVPNTEETHIMENSGWSSRTRAVANYLQTLFMKEAEYDRKVIPMDNLLVGKTRKEASRMFFETLVLKTKDYIHVDQECPFQNINIKPKMKLLKSEF